MEHRRQADLHDSTIPPARRPSLLCTGPAMGVLLRRQAVQMYASAFGEPEPVHYRLSLQYEGHARLCLLAYNRSERGRAAAPGVGTTEAKVGRPLSARGNGVRPSTDCDRREEIEACVTIEALANVEAALTHRAAGSQQHAGFCCRCRTFGDLRRGVTAIARSPRISVLGDSAIGTSHGRHEG